MLVVLPNKEISNYWPLFKDVIRECIPVTKDMLPDFMTNMLESAMTGRIQLWLGSEPRKDNFYLAMITKKAVDDLTGQRALLIYALKILHMTSQEVRKDDWRTFRKMARTFGVQRITAYCGSQAVANAFLKCNNGRGEIIPYAVVELSEEDD